MSPVGLALNERFEMVCRSELVRLRRKTASLSPEHRDRVDALTLELARRLAVRLDAALQGPGSAGLAPVLMRLFAVSPPALEERR
jgi:hypothetical protein